MRGARNIGCAVAAACVALAVCGPTRAEDKPGPEMTKWGPKLSDEEKARIAALPVPQLVETLRTGTTLQAYEALDRLRAGTGWKTNFDLLLKIAAETTRGDMIAELLIPRLKGPRADDEKPLVDEFLDFLEKQLSRKEPAVDTVQAVRSIALTVYLARDWVDEEKPWEPPYASGRVRETLISCLGAPEWWVRQEAINCLALVGVNETDKAGQVVALLEDQRLKEAATSEKPQTKEQMDGWISHALNRIRVTLEWRKQAEERAAKRKRAEQAAQEASPEKTTTESAP